jgi:hypothetical protein
MTRQYITIDELILRFQAAIRKEIGTRALPLEIVRNQKLSWTVRLPTRAALITAVDIVVIRKIENTLRQKYALEDD